VGTVPAHLGPRQDDLKSEMSLYLIAHLLQQVAKELLNLAAAHTNYMGMFLFQAGFVIMLVAIVMHQVQLVHQAARFEKLQGSVHGDAVQLRIFFTRECEQTFGIQMLARLINQVEQNLALAREPYALLFQLIFNAGNIHGEGLRTSVTKRESTGSHELAVLIGELGRALDAADHQSPGIQQVLRLKVASGPLATRVKLDTQEVSNLAVHTVPYFADKLAFGIADAKVGLQRNGLIELKTGTGK
jgi:hypothetical protein